MPTRALREHSTPICEPAWSARDCAWFDISVEFRSAPGSDPPHPWATERRPLYPASSPTASIILHRSCRWGQRAALSKPSVAPVARHRASAAIDLPPGQIRRRLSPWVPRTREEACCDEFRDRRAGTSRDERRGSPHAAAVALGVEIANPVWRRRSTSRAQLPNRPQRPSVRQARVSAAGWC